MFSWRTVLECQEKGRSREVPENSFWGSQMGILGWFFLGEWEWPKLICWAGGTLGVPQGAPSGNVRLRQREIKGGGSLRGLLIRSETRGTVLETPKNRIRLVCARFLSGKWQGVNKGGGVKRIISGGVQNLFWGGLLWYVFPSPEFPPPLFFSEISGGFLRFFTFLDLLSSGEDFFQIFLVFWSSARVTQAKHEGHLAWDRCQYTSLVTCNTHCVSNASPFSVALFFSA